MIFLGQENISHKTGRIIILILLFLFVSGENYIFCQEYSQSGNLIVTAFTNENGLRQSMVSQVCQDERGLIWMVTGDGLHYFDGQEFKAFRVPYNANNNQTDNVMRYMVVSQPDQFILASTSSLLHFSTATGQFKIIFRQEGVYPIVLNAFINRNPLVWIRGLNFCLVKNGKLLPLKFIFKHSNDFPADFIPFDAVQSGQDELLISGEKGLLSVQLKNQVSDSVFHASWIPLAECRSVAATGKGKTIVLAGGRMYSWQKDQRKVLLTDTKLNVKMNLFVDSRGNTWLTDAAFNKIYRYKNGKTEEIHLYTQTGRNAELLSPSVISIFEDSEHNLWFGTDGDGVLLYSPGQVQFHKSSIGFTRCVTEFNHNIWAGTFNNGLWELSPDLGKAKRVNPGYFNNRIYFLDFTTDRLGRLWIATRTGLEVVNKNGVSIWKYPFQCLQAKFIIQGGDSVILVYDGQIIKFSSLEKPSFEETSPYIATRAFLTAGENYWLGTPYGLYRYKQKAGFKKDRIFLNAGHKLSAVPVYGLLFYKGLIWVTTGNGIQCYNAGGKKHPLPACFKLLKNDVIYDMIPDARGRFWITGNNGIACISANRDRLVFFNSKNNLQSPEYNFNAICETRGGDMYFGGIRGLNHINPLLFEPDKKAPEVQLISLSVSDTSYSSCIPHANPFIQLSRKAPHISGKVFSTDYLDPESLLFSFYLEGYQSEWGKPTHDPGFTYRNLPPGKYRLFVKSADTYMNWSKPMQLLAFEIRPPYYSTWWFLALLLTGIIGVTILAVKKVQQIRYQSQIREIERQHAIEKERLRISKDMHDEVGASLTHISILSELAKNQPDESVKTRQIIEKISEISGGVVDEMSEIIWAMNPRNDTLDSFTSYNRQYASSYLESAGIEGSFSFPNDIPAQPMSSELRRNLFLTVKEALHNVVKHSGASQVHVQLFFGEQVLQIIISDNGKGFLIEKTHDWGNGLINMRKRIEEPGGRFDISSEIGKGTTIDLSVNLPSNNKSH